MGGVHDPRVEDPWLLDMMEERLQELQQNWVDRTNRGLWNSRVNGVCDSVTGAVNSAERASETRLADCIPTDATVIQALTLCAMSDVTPMWQAMAVSVVNLFSLCKKRGRRNNSTNSASAICSRLEGKGCDMHTACNATDGEDVA